MNVKTGKGGESGETGLMPPFDYPYAAINILL